MELELELERQELRPEHGPEQQLKRGQEPRMDLD